MIPRERDAARRILLLAPFAPRTQAWHGGARVLARFALALAQRHRVGLLYLRDLDEDPADHELASACDLIEEIPISPRRRTPSERAWHRARLVTALLRGTPTWVSHCDLGRFRARVSEVASQWRPDLVQAEYHVMAQYLDAVPPPRPPRIVSLYEPGAAAAAERLDRFPASPAAWLEARAWRLYESRALAEADAVVVFTDRDRAAIKRLAMRTPIHVIPFGHESPARPTSPVSAGPPTILFTGSFAHPPNRDAAERLVTRILPRVQRAHPDVRLYVVGHGPPGWLRTLSRPGVVVTGLVPLVEPYLDQAHVVVAPLDSGGGMRVKVAEALAAGKAVVASPLAAEGLPHREGAPLILASDDDEFSSAIDQLLGNPVRRAELEASARAWARIHLSWKRVLDDYGELLASVARVRDGRN